MTFDLSTYLTQNADELFFDEKKYSDLMKDVSSFYVQILKSSETFFGLQFKSPYLNFAALLATLSTGKTAVMLSSLETIEGLQRLQGQVPFKNILTDSDYQKSEDVISGLKIDRENPAFIVFSSGSSGLPKGIVLTFDNLYYSALGFIEFVGQKKNDVSLMNLPHHHVGGLMTLWRSFFSGSSLISIPEKPFDIISVVPLQLARALRDQEQLSRLKQCRIILVGGAKLTTALRKEAEDAGLKIYETYGMSETCSLVCLNGEVLPYREVTLDKDHYFLVKGKTLALGFYKNLKFENMPVDQSGLYKTNDIGQRSRDKNGERFVFSHRADVVFISGGENINPLLIEDLLRTHPDISDAYVLPVEDEQWGQMGVCLYSPRKEGIVPDENELKNFLKDKIHPYQIPKRFFPTRLQFEGQLKPKRFELIQKAEKNFLEDLFSYSWKEKPEAPVLVFFHGFTGNQNDLTTLGNQWAEKFSLLYIDLPGHGKTKSRYFSSTEDMLSKLSRFITLFSKTPVLYGYSMGGRVALQLALHYLTPTKLILESAGPGLPTKEEAEKRKKADSEMFNAFTKTEEFIRHWYEQDLFKNFRNSDIFEKEIVPKFSHDLNEWKLSQQLLSQGAFPLKADNLARLKEVSCPVYYIYGSDDFKYKAYAPLFEHSYEIKGAAHNPHKTHLAEMTAILKTILK